MKEDQKIILHLCADLGSDSKPFADDPAFKVVRVGKDIGVENFSFKGDVFGIFANPVCTEFSTANYNVERDFFKGLFLVKHCERIIEECSPNFWVIENPATGNLKHYLGKPKFIYQPWEFGSPWTKKTALWGNFKIPKKNYTQWDNVPKIKELYIKPRRKKPSLADLHYSSKKHIKEFDSFDINDDMSMRSMCSQKFARAFYEANRV